MRLAAVVLAAGQGTRMKSATPKVLHPLAGRPLVEYAVASALEVTGASPLLVIGHGADQVRQTLGARAHYALQAEQLGTGHAVLQARQQLVGRSDAVLVWYADMPLITADTLRRLVEQHSSSGATFTILTVIAEDPHGFGRVIRNAEGRVSAVIEEVDCTPEQSAIRELNAGVYCFDAAWLWDNLERLPISRKGEYYLTDAVAMAVAQGCRVDAVICEDQDELLGINTRVHLAEAEAALRRRINRRWMEAGVTLVDPAATTIEPDVTIGQDTVILPNSMLRGATTVGAGCQIGPNSLIENSVIGDRCTVVMSYLRGAILAEGRQIGPFASVQG